MSAQIETIINAYKTLAKIPSVIGGRLNKTGNRVTAKWSIRNLDKAKTTKYIHDYILDTTKDEIGVVARSDFGVDIGNEVLSSVSPTEKFRAVIKEDREGKDKKLWKQFLEVWSNTTLVQSIDLSALDIHGEVYGDAELASLEWSPDEKALVYIAEKKLKKSEPFIKRKSEEKKDDDSNGPKRGEEYLYRQDWGEQLVGRHMSVIVVCRLDTETFAILQGLPESWCPGQVRFAPDGQGVVGVALETEPRRLGLIFCTNRPGYIFHLTLDGVLTKISQEGMSVRSPRVSADGKLVWLQRTSGGPHHACHELVMTQLGDVTSTPRTLIPIVETKKVIENGGTFHGMYCLSLPAACFSSDARQLVFSTPQQNEIRSYVLDIESSSITDISNKSQPGSTTVLDVKSNVILAVCTNMMTPTQMYVTKLHSSDGMAKWVQISSSVEVPQALANSKVEYLDLEHDKSQDTVKTFTALYLSPSSGDRPPLIVWPHGGPHSGFVNSFSIEAALFNLLGFATIRINFRGSTGAGDASVRCLIGKVGQYDVADCHLALTTLRERDGCSKIYLYGGSYGGFTAGHLAATYPDIFLAMVLRNPLIDLATKGEYADNSDGCAVEAGFEYTESGPASEEQLVAMRRCSPLARAHLVRAPTALMLGSGDLRVPHFQGLQYARRLAANGVPTRVFMYEDNHSLSSLPAEMDNLINGADWLITHTKQ